MWLFDEVLYPRLLRSILWMIVLQYLFLNSSLLLFKMISWYPLSSIADWFLCIFHWKSIIYASILSASVAAFGGLNIRFHVVEKHISSTRFEKYCQSLSPHCLQHVLAMMSLGGIMAYYYDSIFHNFKSDTSGIISYFSSSNDFEQSFIVGHGCFTGMMFSLKYFICDMYLIKFTLEQESKVRYIRHQINDILKDSFFCVIKVVLWYYLFFIVFGSPLNILTLFHLGSQYSKSESESILYSLLNLKLCLNTILSGMLMSFVWNLYLVIFNALATEHHIFPVKVPVEGDKNRTLPSALACKDFDYLKYLAVLDLRILAQCDAKRRGQIFSISHPGGHPHEWKAISGICISSLRDFLYKLSKHTFATAAASESKVITKNITTAKFDFEAFRQKVRPQLFAVPSLSKKMISYFREKPAISYFFDELPNAKLMKLFALSQPFIWIIDVLGYLVSFSYSEDKFGVVQQTLPDIIRLLLDIKMAEEKMPVGLVGIRTYVRDPQGRYEHIYQRLSLKNAVNNALCRIANTYKEDIKEIYLPEEYQKYFQRYLTQND